ncbi:MAG: hypothetical protein QOD86_1958, partial [Miltoncostaeaceae bacterium]|nr:hypothetical protein [Miltoncostaeaceae bacterium]
LLYAGDYDAKGKRILDNFARRRALCEEVVELALTAEQVLERNLSVAFRQAHATSGRYVSEWMALHGGANVQIELQTTPAEDLRDLFAAAIEARCDARLLREARAREAREREAL